VKLFFSIMTKIAGLIVLAPLSLSGCYTVKQGFALLGYLAKAAPLEDLEGEDAVFAERVRDIRLFAREDLGLRDTKNYTRYVQIDRDFLATVVSACADDRFFRHQWWFPVVGRVPYKGFFDAEDARREADKLRRRGLDVWVREVDAFSTLGWFRDPLYSYMRAYPVHRLAELLIHELLHATVYLKGEGDFNEELAEFVGQEGARLYMERRFGKTSPEYRAMEESRARSAAYVARVQAVIAELEAVYSGGASREVVLAEKERILTAAKLPVNNAYLELFRLYHGGNPLLEALYQDCGRDLRLFIAAAAKLRPADLKAF